MRRLEEGYDITDSRYNLWLKRECSDKPDKEVQEIPTNLLLGDAVKSQSIGRFLPKVPEIRKGHSYAALEYLVIARLLHIYIVL